MRVLGRSCALVLLATSLAAPAHAAYSDHMAVPDDIGRNKVPRDGVRPVLVLRVEVGETSDWSQTQAFFAPAAAGDGFTRYWEVNSLGAYRPEAVLPPPVYYETCPMPAPHDDCRIVRDDPTVFIPAVRMLSDALARLDAEHGVDFRDFDTNGDGWTDGVIALLNIPFGSGVRRAGAPETPAGGIALPVGEIVDRLSGLFDQDDFTFDGIRVNAVAVTERQDFANYLHEFGHLLGFDDMYNSPSYDTAAPLRGLEPNPGGAHSLMALCYDRHTMLNAVDRVRAGWATVVEVDEVLAAERLPPVAENGVVYRIGRGSEHFLIENRRPPTPADPWFPFDDGLPGEGGLAIYRVTDRQQPAPALGALGRLFECPNCNEFAPFVFFEQADGEFAYQSQVGFDALDDPHDFFSTGDALLPDPANTAPTSRRNLVLRSNALSGRVTGAAVRDIDAHGAAPDVIATFEPMDTPGCGAMARTLPGAAAPGWLMALAWLALRRRAARPAG